MHLTSTVFIMILIKPVIICLCTRLSSVFTIFIILFSWNYFCYITEFFISHICFSPSI
nr:MAG TPA: hypothetical protein [Caudoviricetes sp.]